MIVSCFLGTDGCAHLPNAEDTIKLSDPFAAPSENAKTVTFDFVIERNGEHLPVFGRVTLDENTPQSDSRIQIGFGYRMIRGATKCFQSRDGKEKFAGIGVSGWLDLGDGWQPYLSTTKDAIDDAPLFDALMDHVFQRIKPLLEQAEKKSFSLHFDDLALGWERALNSQAGDVCVKVGVRAAPPPQPDHSGIAPETPSDRPRSQILQPDGRAGDNEKKVAPSLEITIYRQSDAVLEGALCRAVIRGTDIFVEVNAEHPTVQEALKTRPVNRMALNLMIVSELAQAIVDQNGGNLIRKIFHRDVAAAICDIEHTHHRSRVVARRLIDRVRDSAVAA